MNPHKSSNSLRAEVRIKSEFSWDPAQFRVPRFYAFDLGKLARKIVCYAVVAVLAYGLLHVFWR